MEEWQKREKKKPPLLTIAQLRAIGELDAQYTQLIARKGQLLASVRKQLGEGEGEQISTFAKALKSTRSAEEQQARHLPN